MPENSPTRPSQNTSSDYDSHAVSKRLRQAYQRGDTPSFEDYLVGVDPEQRAVWLFKLFAEDAAIRVELGDRPTWDDYAASFSRLQLQDEGTQSEEVLPTKLLTRSNPDDSDWLDPTVSFVQIDQQDTLRFTDSDDGLLPVGVRLGDRYLIEKEVGRGGMGRVYLAQDIRLQRSVAIKVVRLDVTPTDTTEGQRKNEAFEREAQLGAGLIHPAIATVHDYGFHEGKAFTVFEYVSGESLRDYIANAAPMGVGDVRAVIGELSQAIDFAHLRGVIHRDLKPENIRFTAEQRPKVLDLGLALRFRETSHWKFAGTPAYASPEQCRELPTDGRADQYALALIAYEMLAGRRPFQASDWRSLLQMHQNVEPTRLRQLVPSVPDSVDLAIHRALRKDPNHRFANCESFAVAMGCRLRKEGEHEPSTHTIFDVSLSRYHPRLIRVFHRRGLLMVRDAELWLLDSTALECWPIAAALKLRLKDGALELALRAGKRSCKHWLTFSSLAQQESFIQHMGVVPRNETFEPTKDWSPSRPLPPVVTLVAPYQILSSVEATGDTKELAMRRLLMEAVSHGSEALINVRSEQIVMPYRQRSRAEGLAIRVLDSEGQFEIAGFQCSERAKRLADRTVCLLVGLMVLHVLLATCNRLIVPLGDSMLRCWTILGWIVWPLLVSCRLRWSRLPSSARALALAIYGLIPIWIASIVEMTFGMDGISWSDVNGVSWSDVNAGVHPDFVVTYCYFGLPTAVLLGVILMTLLANAAYKGWGFSRDMRVLLPNMFADKIYRRVAGYLLIASSIAYSVFTIYFSIVAFIRVFG